MVNTKHSKRQRNHFIDLLSVSNSSSNKKQKIERDSTSTPAPDTPLPQFGHCSSSPTSSTQLKNLHQHPWDSVQRNLFPGDKNEAEDKTRELTTSPEAKLLKQLKKLSEMKSIIEDCLENEMTGLVNLSELFCSSDSRSKDAWKKAGRGLMLLKEGLTILNEAENLLLSS